MSNTTLTPATQTLVAVGTSNAAGATTRGIADVRTSLGGFLTMKITNSATGPTVQCEGRVLISHEAGATPTPASAGADWKTIWRFGGGTSNNGVTESGAIELPFGTKHVEVEFVGNTGQAVTVEAFLSEVTDAATA
jgi:hypothetical protein